MRCGDGSMNKPLLSICIPTYNRAEYLEKCLEAIVDQDSFDDRVEVVISDNCSTDSTQVIGLKYQKKYGNIHYYRNETNVMDKNFPLVFQRAKGSLRKLTNDTVIYKPGAIQYMLKAAEDNISERPQLFFLNLGKIGRDKKIVDIEEYIDTLGYFITWIRSIAIWEDDCEDLGIMVEKADSKLAQVPFLLNNFDKHHGAVVYDQLIMDSLAPKNKNLTYGLYNVFYSTFLGFIKPYVVEGRIGEECYERVRERLLLDFFVDWIVIKKVGSDEYTFSDEDLKGLIEATYKDEPYFAEYKRRIRNRLIKARIKKIIG